MEAGTSLVDEIVRIARTERLPVLGMGPSADMEGERPGHRPSDVLPGARGMICFGIPAPRGACSAERHAVELIWRTQNLLYRRLDTVSLSFAQALEERGARAAPIFGCMPMDVDSRGSVVGFVNQIRMGEVLGIGTVGRNALLVHGKHGARLMLGGVLTTEELPAVRIPDEDQPDCPEGCRACISACPVHAISARTRKVNVMRCLAHTARTPLMSRLRFGALAKVRPQAAARFMNLRAFDEHTFHVCSRCIAVCPLGGE